jgi:conjugative relaxase-like TrwC/TraI family protein
VLTIYPGHSADYLLDAVATGRENYYTGAVAAGEPPGRWYGAGAEALGLAGLVDAQEMQALYEHFLDPRDPAFKDPSNWERCTTLGHTGRAYKSADELYTEALSKEPWADAERREQLRLDASKTARRNVAFFDITFSVPKSFTVLHAAFEAQEVKARKAGNEEAEAAWAAHRKAIEDAIWAGNDAALDYLAEHAGYSRVGHHGGAAGRFVDSHDLIVASFFQHDSRDHDPQLHIHNATLNRVQGPDGMWRTIDGRSFFLHRGAAGAVAERAMTEHTTRSLRVLAAMRPDGKAREILGIPEPVNDLFSSRRRAITPKAADLFRAFEAKFGREPNSLERDRLQRQAMFATRRVKSHDGETVEQRLERWERQLRDEIAIGLDKVAADVLALVGKEPEDQTFDVDAVIETALADVQATKSAWRESDLARAINDSLPDYLGGLDGDQAAQLIRGLTRRAIERHAVPLTAEAPGTHTLPNELRLANGASAYERPGERQYATDEHVRSERALRAAARDRTAVAVPPELASAFLDEIAEQGIELGADQAAAVRGVLTSAASVESLVGPAGTGKSFVVGAIARAWQDPTLWGGERHRVVGLAASQIATQVLEDEGLASRNIARWLGIQQRLADSTGAGDDLDWRLGAGDLVVVDESAMADTGQLVAIHCIARDAGAKLLLTGDHRQLAAVGAAGGMELVATVGPSYELTEARRFTHAWERAASLRLREGDPDTLVEYRKHGRIIDGGTKEQTERAAARAWLADTLAERHSLLIVDTNEQAARMSAQLRTELVRLGRVEETGVPLGLQETYAGVGDVVQARRNGWELAGVFGNRRGPINREHYRVLATRDDGGLIVAPILGRIEEGEQLGDRMILPGSYVREHVALGYASTVHAAEGLTVDTAHAVVTSRTGPAARYVALSRGRDENTAHVVTRPIPEDAPTGTVNEVARQDPITVLLAADERAEDEVAAIAEAEQSAAEAASLRTAAERFSDAAAVATAGRTAAMLDQLVDDGVLTPGQRAALAADEGTVSLAQVLRQSEVAGHDPERVLRDAVASRDLGDARSLASVLHHRITESVDLQPAGTRYADWVPKVDNPAWQRHLGELATIADDRRIELGAAVAEQQPQWAVEAFGPVPEDMAHRDVWTERAATVAAHRELTRHDDPDVAVSGLPMPGQAEAYASWCAAWKVLGREEATRAEAEMSDGQLRVRVRAYEREEAWAPDYVAPELSGTRQAAKRHRTTAELRAADAAASADAERRAQLEREAADAGALAQLLDRRAAELEKADEARALWYAHTAETRATAMRARRELATRGIDADQPERPVTAEQLLADQAAGLAAEDQHREITDERDLSNVVDQRDADQRAIEPEPPADTAETNVPDIRDKAARERPAPEEHDRTRVPSAHETADSVRRAQRALAELEQRGAQEQRRTDEQARTAQLVRWHADDKAAEVAHEDDRFATRA